MPERAPTVGTVEPSPEDQEIASRLRDQLTHHAELRLADGSELELPEALHETLLSLLSVVARGDAAIVVPIHSELTTQQAADLLNVSRPYVVRLATKGELPFHQVGTHRRIFLRDLLEYRRRRDQERRRVLRDMSNEGQRLGLYEN